MTAVQLARYTARRLLVLVALVVVLSLAVFALLDAAPGSPEQILLGTRPASEETLNAIRDRYHLDEPFFERYGIWLGGAIQLDFGRSIRTSEPVLSTIGDRLGLTLFLGLYGFVIAMLLGVTFGIVAALNKRHLWDRGLVALGVIGVSAPAFATGVFLLYVFAVLLGWFPVFGQGSGFWDRLWHLALPAAALALTAMALVLKLTRAGMITALDQDYVTFARARGLAPARIVLAYGLRNALIPVITSAGLILGYMLTGAVLVEVTFSLPGLGSLLVESVTTEDIPMVQGLVIVVAVVVILVNLFTDLLYFAVDPRIRFGGGGR